MAQKNLRIPPGGQNLTGDDAGDGSVVLRTSLSSILKGALPCIALGATVTLAFTGSSAASAAITATVVRLVSTQDCFVVFGATPTANTTTSLFLPANVPEYFQFTSGQEVAAIQSTAGGNLYITVAG